MAVWVTLKSGEVRKYNSAGIMRWDNGKLNIAVQDPMEKNAVAEFDASHVLIAEFERPCEITFNADAVDKALDILLTRAKSITDSRRKGKLADLSRLLRKFNPQRREWTR
jgi:hypothetical protein